MHIVKKVTKKNIKSGFVSLTADEVITICNEPSTIEVLSGKQILCERKDITPSMRNAAITNKMVIKGTMRSYYLMPYKLTDDT